MMATVDLQMFLKYGRLNVDVRACCKATLPKANLGGGVHDDAAVHFRLGGDGRGVVSIGQVFCSFKFQCQMSMFKLTSLPGISVPLSGYTGFISVQMYNIHAYKLVLHIPGYFEHLNT
jgi:hypothetical protein